MASPLGSPRSVVFYVEKSSLDDAAAWYGRLLQVEPLSVRDEFVSFSHGQVVVGLHVATPQAGPGKGGQTVYWEVEDLEDAARALRELGATRYRGPLEVPEGGRVTQFADPFGNVIGLFERTSDGGVS